MDEAVIAALVTGGLSLCGVIISNIAASRHTAEKIETSLATSQAVMDTKLEELTREVRTHNNFAQRVPVMEEQIKVINHRIADLERNGTNDG